MNASVIDPAMPAMNSIFLDAPRWDHRKVPAWFAELQQEGWKEFVQLPMPGRREEAWRFADLGKLKFDAFLETAAPEAALEADLVTRSRGLEQSAGRIIFVNGRVVHVDESVRQLGLQVLTLTEDFESLKHLLNSVSSRLGSRKFLALHQAHLRDALLLAAPGGCQVTQPVEIFHWAVGENASVFPRTLVTTAENARLSVVEHHLSAGTEANFSCGATQLVAGHGSVLHYVLAQEWSLASKCVHLSSTHCARDASVSHLLVNLGSAWARTECVSHLEGAGSRSDMLSVSLADQDQEVDQRTLQLHHAPHAYSDLLYKNVLFGASRSIFSGLINVEENAHYTDAYQTCRNLLMTGEAEANAMPGLEINADQVKCSHGSTTGAIDPEEIFYFESRGIPESAARSLLAQGFLAQTFDRLQDESIRTYLTDRVARRFAQISGVGVV